MFSIASVAVESEPYWLRKLRLKHEPATRFFTLRLLPGACIFNGTYREAAESTAMSGITPSFRRPRFRRLGKLLGRGGYVHTRASHPAPLFPSLGASTLPRHYLPTENVKVDLTCSPFLLPNLPFRPLILPNRVPDERKAWNGHHHVAVDIVQ
jgi:hypothetical protein